MANDNPFADLIPEKGQKQQDAAQQQTAENPFSDLIPQKQQETAQAPQGQPESMMDTVGAYGRGMLTKPMLGGSFADEALAGLATVGTTIYKGLTNPSQPVGILDDYGKNLQSIERKFAQDRQIAPYTTAAGDIAGDIRTGLKVGSLFPGIGQFARGNPLTASSGIGAISGGVYAFGGRDGSVQERLQSAGTGAALGGVLGPVGFLAANQISKIGPLTQKVQKWLEKRGVSKDFYDGGLDPLVPVNQKTPLQSTSTVPPSATMGEAIRLPAGVKSGDVNMMRAEEAARQGLLGDDYQKMISQVDDTVKSDAQAVTQSLSGNTGKTSEQLLEGALSNAKKRFQAEKRLQNSLMNTRNDAIANAKVYTDFTRETFGDALNTLKETPDFKVNLPSNPDIANKFEYISSLLAKGKSPDVDMAEMAAWRRSLNNYPQGSQQSVLAGQMAKTYDGWLESLTKEAFKAGDEDVVKKIFDANKSYAEFKKKYGTNAYSGQSKILEKIIQQDALTPDQLVNMTFGKGLSGKDTTNQVIQRLIKIMPEGPRREAIRTDMKAGLFNRALEQAADNNSISAAKLLTNLQELRANRAFRANLAKPEELQKMDALIKDLRVFVDSGKRRDVYSPSGPMVLRGLSGLVNALGYSTSKLGGRAISEVLQKGIKEGTKAPDRRLVEQSVSEFATDFSKVIRAQYGMYGVNATSAFAGEYQNIPEVTITPLPPEQQLR